MHKALLATALMAAMALAGCSGDDHAKVDDVTCPDGSTVTAQQQEDHAGHHDDAFDPMSLCPTPPEVELQGLPATVAAYRSASFTWVVDNGSVQHGHSMLMSIRYSLASVADAEVTVEKYPEEVLKREHQDLPKTFKGNISFSMPGKVYVRAYAQVQGDDYPRRDVWSPEVVLEVTPVEPTGTTHTINHGAGLVAATVTETVEAMLGDAIQLHNEDAVEHTLSLQTGPSDACPALVAAPLDGDSEPCVLDAPGTYTYRTDGQQPKTVTVTVTV